MDHDEQAWLKFVQTEQAYRDTMADLRHFDMVSMLREGLLSLPWRRAALAVLDYEAYRRVAELLRETANWKLLDVLVRSASSSLDSDIRK